MVTLIHGDCLVEMQTIPDKSVELCEWLIRTYTNEGDIVLDNTMGSGSTGVASVNTKRNFIGIELTDKYFEIAKKRVAEAQSQLKLF